MSQAYKFSGLKSQGHFRLVSILPGERNSPLQCAVSEFPLRSLPAYEALSYAWGAQDVIQPTIALNGQKFSIPWELKKALRRL